MPIVLKTYTALCKTWISLFAACSAATGYFLVPVSHQGNLAITLTGVFLLACGASALNQVQDRDIDGRMERTRRRPLPSGRMRPVHGVVVSTALAGIGLLLLLHAGGRTAALLGLIALFWYNGVYTGLKRVTAFAAVPGALVGAIPPAIGWVSAGGSITDPRILVLCFIFFMWQVPHFWALILHYGKEYENAGLPSLTRVLGRNQIARITFVWIVAATFATFALPLYGSVRSPLIIFSFIPPALWLIGKGRSLISSNGLPSAALLLFKTMNLYLFILMSLLSLESIFSPMP